MKHIIKNREDDNLDGSIVKIIEFSQGKIPLDTIQQTLVKSMSISEASRLMALGTMNFNPIKSLEYLFSYALFEEFETYINNKTFETLISVMLEITEILIDNNFEFKTVAEMDKFRNASDLFIDNLVDKSVFKPVIQENPLQKLFSSLKSYKEQTDYYEFIPRQHELFQL